MKNIITTINAAVDAFKIGFKEGMNLTQFNFKDAEMIFEGIYVFKSSRMITLKGLSYAMCVNLNTLLGEIPIIIICNDFQEKFSKETQEFILWHEIGHIKNHHLEKGFKEKEEKVFTSAGFVPLKENVADRYALKNYLEKSNVTISALKKVRKILNELIEVGKKDNLPKKSLQQLRRRKAYFEDLLGQELISKLEKK